VSVRVSLEEKRMSVFALALTLTLFYAPQAGDELFPHNAYNQITTKNLFIEVSKNTPLFLHLHSKLAILLQTLIKQLKTSINLEN
jgi:hypothetical protein